MTSRRRHADDFTDSLISFRQTDSEEQSQTTPQTYSEDSLDTDSMRSKQYKNDKHSYIKINKPDGSIILAGNIANQQYSSLPNLNRNSEENCHKDNADNNRQFVLTDTLNVSDKTLYSSIKPDLNKCINLFHNEHLNKKHNSSEEYSSLCSTLSEVTINKEIDSHHSNKNKSVEIQCNLYEDCPHAVQSDLLKSKPPPDIEIRRSKSCIMLNSDLKRDTNYNIKTKFSVTITPTKISDQKKINEIVSSLDALSLSKSAVSSNKEGNKEQFHSNKEDNTHFTEENQKHESTSNEKAKEFDSSDLRIFLNSLEGNKCLKEAAMQQERLLRRLSANFYDSPKNFTERLLTIIEESFVNNDSRISLEHPEISFCRLTQELRKMCKFIDDETIPEWPQSPSTPICSRNRSRGSNTDSLRQSLSAFATPDKDLFPKTSPRSVTPRNNIKNPKKVYRRTPKNVLCNMKKNPLQDDTSTFESLEAFCQKLYPDEYRTITMEEKHCLQPPSRHMDSILHKCKNQMDSLENSPNILEQLKKAGTSASDLAIQRNIVPEAQTRECRLLSHKKCDKNNSKNVPDTLKKQIGCNKRYERIEPDDLENTIMYQIAKKRQRCLDTAKKMMEIDADSKLEVQQICPNIVINQPVSPTCSDAKFMETLMSVKNYQNYLEQCKPLFNSYSSCSSYDKEDVKEVRKKMSNATLHVPSASRKKNTSPSSMKHRSPNKVIISKTRLFNTPGKSPNKICRPKRIYFPDLVAGTNKQKHISSHARNIYQQIGNYDHVISPVGKYIRGTEPQLMKNLRPETDKMLLTSRKKQTKRSLSPKPKLKFRLSPKQPKEKLISATGKENITDNFSHPKVHYKLPSHVRTIKENENQKVGNRMNELLRFTQDKVVIRHEGRTKSIPTICEKQLGINYDSTEESVHVEQIAHKTSFSRLQ